MRASAGMPYCTDRRRQLHGFAQCATRSSATAEESAAAPVSRDAPNVRHPASLPACQCRDHRCGPRISRDLTCGEPPKPEASPVSRADWLAISRKLGLIPGLQPRPAANHLSSQGS